jgi:hypothetical protein
MSSSTSLRRAALAVFATAMAGIMVLTAPSWTESTEFVPITRSHGASSMFDVSRGHAPRGIEFQSGRKLLMLTTNLLVAGIGEGLMALIILYILLVLSVSMTASISSHDHMKIYCPCRGVFWARCGELIYSCNRHAKMA